MRMDLKMAANRVRRQIATSGGSVRRVLPRCVTLCLGISLRPDVVQVRSPDQEAAKFGVALHAQAPPSPAAALRAIVTSEQLSHEWTAIPVAGPKTTSCRNG